MASSNAAFFARNGLNVNNFVIVNSTALALAANVTINTSAMFIGNSTANYVANSILVTVVNSTSQANLNPLGLVVGSTTVNGTAISVPLLLIGNSTVNLFANSLLLQLANSTGTANLTPTTLAISSSVVNGSAIALGANVFLDVTKLSIGNTTVNVFVNSSLITIGSASGVANLTPTSLIMGITTVNTTEFAIGANVFLSTTTLSVGNSTANLFANSILIAIANSTAQLNLQPTQIVLGGFDANTTAVALGANVFLSTTTLSVGNTTANLLANSILISLANSTATLNLQPTQLVLGGATLNTTAIVIGANVLLNTTLLSIGNSTINAVINSSMMSLSTINVVLVNAFATTAQYLNNTANLVLTTDKTWGAAPAVNVAASTANTKLDLSTGINFTISLTVNTNFDNPINMKAGQQGQLLIKQDATGSRLITFGTAWNFLNATTPVASTNANAVDRAGYYCENTSVIHISYGKNSAT